MEDFDILNKFDNDKLIDIVKNYKLKFPTQINR